MGKQPGASDRAHFLWRLPSGLAGPLESGRYKLVARSSAGLMRPVAS